MSQNFANALGEVARAKQFTMIGDIHDNLDLLRTVGQKENFEQMKAAGVKHLFIEVPPEFQRQYNYLVGIGLDGSEKKGPDGKRVPMISDAEFQRRMEKKVHLTSLPFGPEQDEYWKLHIQMIRAADAAGMKIHCIDTRGNLEAAYGDEFRKKGAGKYGDVASYVDDVHRIRMPDGSMASPLTDDRKTAETISKLAGNEKGMIFMGINHGRRSFDLDEALGQDRTARVEIFNSAMNKRFEEISIWRDRRSDERADPDPAAFTYFIGSDKVEWGDRPAATQQIDMSPLKASSPSVSPAPAGQRKARPGATP